MRSEHPELARPLKRCLGALDTVSWPWIPAWGSLEPPRRDGENAQKTGKNGKNRARYGLRSVDKEGRGGITWVVEFLELDAVAQRSGGVGILGEDNPGRVQ